MNGHNTCMVGGVNQGFTEIVEKLPQEDEAGYGAMVWSQPTHNGLVVFTLINKNPISESNPLNVNETILNAAKEKFGNVMSFE